MKFLKDDVQTVESIHRSTAPNHIHTTLDQPAIWLTNFDFDTVCASSNLL